jgi:hypothetical protein
MIRVTGAVAPSDFEGMCRHMLADPAVLPNHLRFSDLRLATDMPGPAQAEEIAHILDAFDRRKPPHRAVILTNNNMKFGMARLFHAHRDNAPENINIVRDYDAALAWLGLPPDTPDLFRPEDWE